MIKTIIKRFSESIMSFMDNIDSKTRTRQLYAVASVLTIFTTFIIFNVYSSEAMPMQTNLVPQETEFCTESKQVISEKAFSAPTAGVVTEMSQILYDTQQEVTEEVEEPLIVEDPPVEEVPQRENVLYYVTDQGMDFYLDSIYQDYLWNKLKEYNHTELYEICLAQMYHESQFEINIVSATNDHGLCQINAGNFKWLHDTLDIESLDDPYDSIDSGVYILVTNYEKYGDVELALIAYNRGSVGSEKSTKYSRCILQNDIDCLNVWDGQKN